MKTCKTCGNPLVIKQTRNSSSRSQKQYYYTAYYFCPKCQKMYLDDKFKVSSSPPLPSLFEDTKDAPFDADIWTDGAARNNGKPNAKAAWAYVSGQHEDAGLVEGEKQTNNVAEALAIYQALKWASSKGYKRLRLHTDSQISLYNIAKPVSKIAVNREIFADIKSLIKIHNLEVQFIKVLGHSGDINNERADRLANTLAGISK